jgi:hydroxyacylglutathione hydrolase
MHGRMPEAPRLQVQIVPVTPFQQNTSLVWCARTLEAAFVDPGGESERLITAAQAAGVSVQAIWLTHGHLDHAGAASALRRHYGVPVIGPHRDDQWLLDDIPAQAARWGMPGAEACTPDRWLEDGDTLALGDHAFGVSHCPGHTPGHVVIHSTQARLAFVGDVLFKGSIGRTDFPRGDFGQLVASITGKLWPLGEAMQFIPGHGAMSTFGWERKTNPFVSDLTLAQG